MAKVYDFEEYRKKRETQSKEELAKTFKPFIEDIFDTAGCVLIFVTNLKDSNLNNILIHFSINVKKDKELSVNTIPFTFFRLMMLCLGFMDDEMIMGLLEGVDGQCVEITLKGEEKDGDDIPVPDRVEYTDEFIVKKICTFMKWNYNELAYKIFN